jgi:arsenate reductase (thioredoxin)
MQLRGIARRQHIAHATLREVNPAKQRVLFVCIGNACRSQMAEGFARTYGAQALEAFSAGLAPAFAIPQVTLDVMKEKGIDLSAQYPKPFRPSFLDGCDIAINLSGELLPDSPKVREWKVADPIGQKDDFHRRVRDQIETLVMELILELRRAPAPAPRTEAPQPRVRTRPKLLRG